MWLLDRSRRVDAFEGARSRVTVRHRPSLASFRIPTPIHASSSSSSSSSGPVSSRSRCEDCIHVHIRVVELLLQSQSVHTHGHARVFVFTCEMATPTTTSRALVEVRYVCIFLYFDARDGRTARSIWFDRLT